MPIARSTHTSSTHPLLALPTEQSCKKAGVRQDLGKGVLGRRTSMCQGLHTAGSVGSEWEPGVVRDGDEEVCVASLQEPCNPCELLGF